MIPYREELSTFQRGDEHQSQLIWRLGREGDCWMPPPLHILPVLSFSDSEKVMSHPPPHPPDEESGRNRLFRNHNTTPRLPFPSQSSSYLAWDREMGKGSSEINFSIRPEPVAKHNSSWSPEAVKCQIFVLSCDS